LICVTCSESQFIMGNQGRNLEAGADAEAMEGAAYWPAPSACLLGWFLRPGSPELRTEPRALRLLGKRSTTFSIFFFLFLRQSFTIWPYWPRTY